MWTYIKSPLYVEVRDRQTGILSREDKRGSGSWISLGTAAGSIPTSLRSSFLCRDGRGEVADGFPYALVIWYTMDAGWV